MALSATDQNTFNGAVATALVYSLRNAGTVQLEIGKLIDRTVLEILNYKNTDIGVTKDVYAFIRGEEGTGRTNKDIAGAVDFSAVLNALAAIRTDLDALKTTVEALPKAEPAPVPAPPAAVPFHGVDVSSYQDSVLDTWIASEDFLIAKATEGKGFNAPSYAAQIAKIRASGKKPGAYHYAWPENGWQADFDHFVSVAGLKVGEVGALDFEPWSSKQPNADPATFPAYVVGWADAFKARFGVDPLFYAPDYFVRSIKANATPEQWARISVLPFWKPGNKGVYVTDPIAGYGDTFGFQTLAMWQWTDRPLDRNILYVDWSTLAVKEA